MTEGKRVFADRRMLFFLLTLLIANLLLYKLDLDQTGTAFPSVPFYADYFGKPDYALAQKCYEELLASRQGREPTAIAQEMQERMDELALRVYAYGPGEESAPLMAQYAAAAKLQRQAAHIAGYSAYLDGIRQRGEELQSVFTLFPADSFPVRNAEKTVGDYAALAEVTLTLGRDGAVETLVEYKGADYALLALLSAVCLSFADERKKGLWPTVWATPDGRGRLAARRLRILAVTALAGTLIFHGGLFAAGLTVFGGAEELGRAVQSVPMLGAVTWKISLGQFVLILLLGRAATALTLALLLWLALLLFTRIQAALAAAAGLMAGEYLLYTRLPAASRAAVLRDANLAAFLHPQALFTGYENVRFLGRPVGRLAVLLWGTVLLGALLAAACVLLSALKRPRSGSGDRSPGRKRPSLRVGLTGTELYKLLFAQKGLLVLLALFLAGTQIGHQAAVPKTLADQICGELQGPVGDALDTRLEDLQAQAEDALEAGPANEAAWQSGLISYQEYYTGLMDTLGAQQRSAALASVQARAAELKALSAERGETLYLLDETIFEAYFGTPAERTVLLTGLLALCALALLLSGIFSYERVSRTRPLLLATPQGRGRLLRIKFIVSLLLATVVYAGVYAPELWQLSQVLDGAELNAPVQSLSMLGRFPLDLDIREFLAALYIGRWFMLALWVPVLLLISALGKSLERCAAAAVLLMSLPTAVYLAGGVDLVKMISPASAVALTPLLTGSSGRCGTVAAWLAGLGALSAWSAVKSVRLWSCVRKEK